MYAASVRVEGWVMLLVLHKHTVIHFLLINHNDRFLLQTRSIFLTATRIQFSKHKIKHLVSYVCCPVFLPSGNQMPEVIAHVLNEVVFFFSPCAFLQRLIGCISQLACIILVAYAIISVNTMFALGLVLTLCLLMGTLCRFPLMKRNSHPPLLEPHTHTCMLSHTFMVSFKYYKQDSQETNKMIS